ncbi:DUF397 domain-containing protein [Streptomyces sp. NPDC006798]|uniref:DUF397 domain-containing protein n=1 Tax=Streptomyces sp. NPDC006798 TaxID=3155462 RepID=UPI0033C2BC91
MVTEPEFFTSSYSSNGGNCVEIAANLADTYGIVPVRDTKLPDGPTLTIPTPAFAAFLTGIKAHSLHRA